MKVTVPANVLWSSWDIYVLTIFLVE